MTLTVGSLFSGAGGFDLGLEQAGFTIVWQVEKDKACRRILKRRFLGHPKPKVFDDVCQFHGWSGGEGGIDRLSGRPEPHAQGCGEWDQPSAMRVDLLVGGWPCQDLSVAGKRKGLAGERSGLFHEVIRIAKEIQPTWGLFENVPGLLSSHGGRDMATVLEGLRECWPVVGYRVLDSQYFGVAQRRRRVFFVCGPTERSVEEILFEPEGGEGHFAASEKTRPELADTIGTSADRITGRQGGLAPMTAASLRSRSSSPGVNPPGRGGEDDMNLVVSRALCASQSGMRLDPNQEDFIVAPITGNGCYGDQIGNESHLTVTACLNSGGNAGGFRTEPGEHLVLDDQGGSVMNVSQDGKVGTLRSECHGHVPIVGVRRLTPTETERLQGFPDGWTCLCQPLESYDHMKCQCADGPRYRMMGNAVTVNVIRWFGKRIIAAHFNREDEHGRTT